MDQDVELSICPKGKGGAKNHLLLHLNPNTMSERVVFGTYILVGYDGEGYLEKMP